MTTKQFSQLIKVDVTELANILGGASAESVLSVSCLEELAQYYGYSYLDHHLNVQPYYPQTTYTAKPGVIMILGHVDHGKTSLVDAIRKSTLTDKEFGGITQTIRAYPCRLANCSFTIIDTPGHRSFSAMRNLVRDIADLALLVIALDSGLQEQTLESIEHIRSNNTPYLVVFTKADRSNPKSTSEIKQALLRQGIVLSELGGDISSIEVSTKESASIEALLDLIKLQLEVLDLRAPSSGLGMGIILDNIYEGKGGLKTNLILKSGELNNRDIIYCQGSYGIVKSISCEEKLLKKVLPTTPVTITGLSATDTFGKQFTVLPNLEAAKKITTIVNYQFNSPAVEDSIPSITLEDMVSHDESKTINLVLKADSQGSLKAMSKEIEHLFSSSLKDYKYTIILSGTGPMTESELERAQLAQAVIITFNTKEDRNLLKKFTTSKFIQAKTIYKAAESLEQMFILKEDAAKKVLGSARVIAVFTKGKSEEIAGCLITSGYISVNSKVEITRQDKFITQQRVKSIQHQKASIQIAREGQQYGLIIPKYIPQIGDEIRFFE